MKKKTRTKTKLKLKSKSPKKVQPIPKGYHTLTSYLMVRGASAAMDFYKKALGAKERFRMCDPGGKSIVHAEMMIGDSLFMIADESPYSMCQSPTTLKGSAVGFVIYVKDATKAFKRAVTAGAKVKQPLEDKFYGERSGSVEDPFGHNWTFMTHIEDVSMKEMNRRMAEFPAKTNQKAA